MKEESMNSEDKNSLAVADHDWYYRQEQKLKAELQSLNDNLKNHKCFRQDPLPRFLKMKSNGQLRFPNKSIEERRNSPGGFSRSVEDRYLSVGDRHLMVQKINTDLRKRDPSSKNFASANGSVDIPEIEAEPDLVGCYKIDVEELKQKIRHDEQQLKAQSNTDAETKNETIKKLQNELSQEKEEKQFLIQHFDEEKVYSQDKFL